MAAGLRGVGETFAEVPDPVGTRLPRCGCWLIGSIRVNG
jgi:hypothetical protein